MDFWNGVVIPAFQKVFADIIGILPKLLAAVLILGVGWIIAKLFENLVRRLLNKVGFDKLAEKTGFVGFLKNAGFQKEVSWLIGRLSFWMLALLFLLSAAETMELTALAVSIEKIVSFIPNLIVVILILVFGTVMARLVGRLVRASAMDAEIDFADFLGKLVTNVIIIFIVVMAISQLEIESTVLDNSFAAMIGAFALAVALTLGLGTRSIAYNIVCGIYARKTYNLRQQIQVNDVAGEIMQIGTVNTVIDSKEGIINIPNCALIENKTLVPKPASK